MMHKHEGAERRSGKMPMKYGKAKKRGKKRK